MLNIQRESLSKVYFEQNDDRIIRKEPESLINNFRNRLKGYAPFIIGSLACVSVDCAGSAPEIRPDEPPSAHISIQNRVPRSPMPSRIFIPAVTQLEINENLKLLERKDPEVRIKAANFLIEHLGKKAAIDPLIELYEKENDENVKREIYTLLAHIFYPDNVEESIDKILMSRPNFKVRINENLKLLESKDPKVRMEATIFLFRNLKTKAADLFIKLYEKEKDEGVKREILSRLEMIFRMYSDEEFMKNLLMSPNANSRRIGFEIADRYGHVKLLYKALKSDNEEVRIRSVEMLGEILFSLISIEITKDEVLIEITRLIKHDPSSAVRRAAFKAKKKITSKQRRIMVEQLPDF